MTNAEFLKVIFGDQYGRVHVTGFADSPDSITKDRRAVCWGGGSFVDREAQLTEDVNTYFTISLFGTEDSGKSRRRKALFESAGCIMVDDVGTKVLNTSKLPPPSWRLETSPGNCQWGFILRDDTATMERVSSLQAAMVAKGLAVDGNDPGMKGVTRYARLPVGANRKTTYLERFGPSGWKCQTREFEPQRTFTLADLMVGFGITEDDLDTFGTGSASNKPRSATPADDPVLKAIASAGRYLGKAGSKGWHNVICPNVEQHSDGDDSGSAVFIGVGGTYGYKCHHGHPKLTFPDFVELVDAAAGNEVLADAVRAATTADFSDVSEDEADAERAKTDEARREFQKRETQRIGEGAHKVPTPELLTPKTALDRFVFLSDGSRVADIFNPHYDLAFQDWAGTYAASTAKVKQSPKMMGDGSTKTAADKEVPISALWKASPRRKTAVCRTFKAGGNMLLLDPHGRQALNTWMPYGRTLIVPDLQAEGINLFLDHIAFLFPVSDDRERFLNWLAHIEQKPGELPHTAWLHVARNFGLGRNWLASVLARVWTGNVAANLDLVQLLKGGFNGQLSRKVLAVVDEIREGGRDTQWEHAERLKSLFTEEQRTINPKYGRQSIEFNACRWLLFSNHLSAIPMECGDRRIEVVVVDAAPKDAAYYSQLYKALANPRFIAAVATYLGQRDIGLFNPGAHAARTEAKQAATQASMSPIAQMCELLLRHWTSDVITAEDLRSVFDDSEFCANHALTAAHRRVLEQAGVVPWGLVRIKKSPTRVSILRNSQRWKGATADAIREEVGRYKPPPGTNARDFILSAQADWDDFL